MKILFIHEVNYSAKPIYEMHEFPEHLAALGHDIAFWHFPEGQSLSKNLSEGWKRWTSGRVLSKENLTLYSYPFVTGNIVGRLATAAISHYWASKIYRDFKPDVIVSLSVPTQGWQALWVAKRMRIPFVFRALDVSHLIRKSPFQPLIRLAEKYIYQNSDFISANNAAMLDYCCPSPRKGRQKVGVHLPPLDLHKFSDGNRSIGRQLLGLRPEDKVVMYMGTFFYFSGLKGVIEEFLRNRVDEKLVLVGGGEQEEELKLLTTELGGNDSVLFPGYVSFDALPDILKAADVAINPMEQSLVSDVALPNKVLQYLAAGVITVSTPLKGLKAALGNSPGLGWGSSPSEVVIEALSIIRKREEFSEALSSQHLLDLFADSLQDFEASLADLMREK